jgi:circadian clock protein KaiC
MGSEMNKRTQTGIKGLDGLVEGGFPQGSMIVLAGSPGSGKTIAAAQYLYHGAKKLGEEGVYISFGERKEFFYENMERFGLDFEELEKSGRFQFLDLMTTSNAAVSDTLELALDEVRRMKAQRLVLDSFSALAAAFSNKTEARIILQLLEKVMRDINCTTLLLVEIPTGQAGLGFGFEEFVSDGIILFETIEVRSGIQKRAIIRKMRGTNHDQNYCKIVISDQGLSLASFVAKKGVT